MEMKILGEFETDILLFEPGVREENRDTDLLLDNDWPGDVSEITNIWHIRT